MQPVVKILILNAPNLSIKNYYAAKDITIDETHAALPGIFPLKQVGIQANESGISTTFYTPDCISAVRSICKPGEYHWIVNGYDAAPYQPKIAGTGGYTEPYEDVYLGTWLSTVRVDGHESLYATHEFEHFCTRKIDRSGFPIDDIMDRTPVKQTDGSIKMIPYYLNEQPNNPDSNYNRQWAIIYPYKNYLSNPTPILRYGQKSFWVGVYQQQLAQIGYDLPITGYFGSKTLAATKDLQSKHGLATDGIVGPKTLYYSVLK